MHRLFEEIGAVNAETDEEDPVKEGRGGEGK